MTRSISININNTNCVCLSEIRSKAEISDGELPINIDTHKTSRDVEEKEEEAEIKDETAKAGVEATHGIHDTVKPTDTNDFLRGGHIRDPENLDDSNDQHNASSSSHGIDLTDFVDGSTPPILELGVVRKSSESSTPRDDPSALSASRTPDDHVSGTIANTAGDLTSSSLTAPSAAHQSHYRGVADQFEGSPTRKSAHHSKDFEKFHVFRQKLAEEAIEDNIKTPKKTRKVTKCPLSP
ncbi:hypothetical protein WN51_08037 [Melipona quadrifasciata]|uniref:Uncharacterized protein n=1 Tax=Melipona quadrifasciata TaxID=166423 RepID=A0A0N0BC41_9HYME|nr:hypothetical protein WN51_08037 [Melipona quadrifasciata]